MESWEEFGGRYRMPIFWRKTNPVPVARCVSLAQSIEVCVWLTKGRVKKENYNWELGMYSDVIESTIPQKEGSEVRHPTQKPLFVGLMLVALLSKPGEIVFDPFCGSGTFLLAAKLLGRRFLGRDSEENYCSIARRRIEENLRNESVKRIYDNFLRYILQNCHKKQIKRVYEFLGLGHQYCSSLFDLGLKEEGLKA
jgi:DNA modification methylase